MVIRILLVAALVYSSALVRSVAAYGVGPALSLENLEIEADLVCKVVAVSSKPAKGKPLKEIRGFTATTTELKVIEAYKGRAGGERFLFLHYAPAKDGFGFRFMPQNYEFEIGQAYILFAKKTDREGVFQQLWQNHKSKEDQGLVRAADKAKHGDRAIRDVLWTELTRMLASDKRKDETYAIRQIDQMSGGGYVELKHFKRAAALKAIQPHIHSKHAEVAKLAIKALGSRNPYLSGSLQPGWLATIGKGYIPGYSKWEFTVPSPAKQFWKPLAQVANADHPPEIRALAIRALGLTREPALKAHITRWIADAEPLVRKAGTILLADFPDLADAKTIRHLAKDAKADVRSGVAIAIGFGQMTEHVHLLGVLINDHDPRVASAAALSLLSFPMESARMTLEANVKDSDFRSLFVNALAKDNPAMYLDALCEIVRRNLRPKHWWGGRIPWGVSWDILFKYVKKTPAIQKGRLDDALDAMESPQYYSSSEPRDLYALYLQRNMTKRAKSFREKCCKRLTYDIDYYFKMVDKNPGTYQRIR